MSMEQEFVKRLHRKDRTFEENFRFAINAWQSFEFTLNNKYEVILQWLTQQQHLEMEQVTKDSFKDFYKLRCQPGLISPSVKKCFVEWFLNLSEKLITAEKGTRKLGDLLQMLLKFELLQDLYRMDYKLHTLTYSTTLKCYDIYLEEQQQKNDKISHTYESEFIVALLKGLKDYVERINDVAEYSKLFTAHTLNDLCRVLILLRRNSLYFFEELFELEQLLTADLKHKALVNRIVDLPSYAYVLTLECAIVNRRGIEILFQSIVHEIFFKNFLNAECPILPLSLASSTLEIFRIHDIHLNIKMNNDQSLIDFMGDQLYVIIKRSIDAHLFEVLIVLCVTLRFNPLILEKHLMEITAWVMFTSKANDVREQHLFENFLILLMDTFRRLGKMEKFVVNILKKVGSELNKGKYAIREQKALCICLQTEPDKKKRKISTDCKYYEILKDNLLKSILENQRDETYRTANESFSILDNFWPSATVGVSFSKLISGLTIKPSIVIWKSLTFGLKQLLADFETKSDLKPSDLLLLAFNTALLSQYFAGIKISEQSIHFMDDIYAQRLFTKNILSQFGKFILSHEYQTGIIISYLQLCYFATCFELMLVYYKADGCNHISLDATGFLEQMHSFLSAEEWHLIRQRVFNFGTTDCKYYLQRLHVQKNLAYTLFQAAGKTTDISIHWEDANILLNDIPMSKWLISKLERSDRQLLAQKILQNIEMLSLCENDLELLELVVWSVYQKITNAIDGEYSLLKSVLGNGNTLFKCNNNEAYENLCEQFINKINQHSREKYKSISFNTVELECNLKILSRLAIGHLRLPIKTISFALHVCLYIDLAAAKENTAILPTLEIMEDLLNFGQEIVIYKYFTVEKLLSILPVDKCWIVYDYIFRIIKTGEKNIKEFLKQLIDVIKRQSLTTENNCLLLAALAVLPSLSGITGKRLRTHFEELLQIFADYVNAHFTESCDGTSATDKSFVQNTLQAFVAYVISILTKSQVNEKKGVIKTVNDAINDNFRRVMKIYIAHSIDYRNPHAIHLMKIALCYRQLLHFDQLEIEVVLNNYWQQLNMELENGLKHHDVVYRKSMEAAVKMIMDNKTNEDLLLILKSMCNNINDENAINVLQLLQLLAQCPFSTIKGAIFNEEYKHIVSSIFQKFQKGENYQCQSSNLILNTLYCHQAVIANTMVPVCPHTIDNIIAFLMEINLKRYFLYDIDNDFKTFCSLHLAITEICFLLIKHRYLLLADRMPQYLHLFKDLIQSVIWYKSERQKDCALPMDELNNIMELAIKMEALMHLIAKHSVDAKRIAPFLLTFVINLIVSNKKSRILYNKIKIHIEAICYQLINICDHRVNGFILRSSNEAGRQLYETLIKNHQKYHKFKGKI